MQVSKVLIIGYGSIAQKHVNALLKKIPFVEIHALRSSASSGEVEGIRSFYSLDELNLSEYDFVIISNPSYLHAETILQIANHTRAFFIEKPAFLNVNEGEKLIHTIGGKLNYVACNLRFLDCLVVLKTWIVEAKIHPVFIDFKAWSYLPDWRPAQDYRKSYSASITKGGGVIYDLIHEPDYIFWLFGKPIASTIYAAKLSSLAIESPDTAHLKFEYPNFCVAGSLSYAARITKRSINIIAEEGLFEIDLLENTITKNGVRVFQSSQRIMDTYLLQMEHFIDCLVADKKPINDIKQALNIAELMKLT